MTSPFASDETSEQRKKLKEIRERERAHISVVRGASIELNLRGRTDDGQISPLPRKTHLSRTELRGRDRRLSDRYVGGGTTGRSRRRLSK